MPRGKDFKRLIRSRMRKTGESYTTARAHLSEAQRRRSPSNPGGPWMYPFERFTERAKHVMTFAQQEAEGAGVNYIGTEHLLLGLLHESDGVAAHALANLGVDSLRARETVERLVGEVRPGGGMQIVPTSRTKKVIELAFEEAREMGDPLVGTEHLLLAILTDGDGVGARALFELGVTIEAARAEVRRLCQVGAQHVRASAQVPLAAPEPPMGHGPELAKLLAAAERLARQEDSRIVLLQHLFLAMAEQDRTASILEHHGVVVSAMRARLTPPAELATLRGAYRQLRMRRQEAVARQQYELAAVLRNQEQEALGEYGHANQAWLDSWGGGGEPPSQ
jgi:ATP-dependent Clp protease ATP-binding subunit ClpA